MEKGAVSTPDKITAQSKAGEYQSPYALQTGEEDLLTVGVTATSSNEQKRNLDTQKSADLKSVRSSNCSGGRSSPDEEEKSSPEDEIAKIIKRALVLYAEDKI